MRVARHPRLVAHCPGSRRSRSIQPLARQDASPDGFDTRFLECTRPQGLELARRMGECLLVAAPKKRCEGTREGGGRTLDTTPISSCLEHLPIESSRVDLKRSRDEAKRSIW